MKYTQSIIINKPLDEVVQLFDSVDNLYEWMEGLQSFEPLTGTPGEVGSTAKLVFKMGKRELEMIETITAKNLPEEFSGTYDAKGVHNIVRNFFEQVDEHTTKHTADNEFQFKGFMKVIAFLIPGAFKKQSYKYLQAFKDFAERK